MIYGHGDDAYQYAINFKANFSSNVWHERTSTALLEHLKVKLSNIANYPSPNADPLAAQIATHHQLDIENVIVTNGATEAFYMIAHLFKGKTVHIGTPTFSEYEDACSRHDMQLRFYKRSEAAHTHFEDDLAFICNPNNPDGFSNSVSEIRQLVAACPNTTFVIDEAYCDFTFQITSCLPLLSEFNNIIIVKSLTKLFSIPGLRLGYLLCSPKMQKKLLHFKMPWNVNALAIAAGQYIFEHYEQMHPNMSVLLKHCNTLQEAIRNLNGFTVQPSKTNYFLVRLKTPDATKLKNYLAHEHQLLIRNASNFRGLDEHYIRIASQDAAQNKLLINALKSWVLQY
jgi:threonine-phosphate decarboxylase